MLSGVVCVFSTTFGVKIACITRCREVSSYIVMAMSIMISVLIGLFIMKKSHLTFKEYGVCKHEKGSFSTILFFIPLILMEVVAVVINGIAKHISVELYMAVVLFVIMVGINEEIYFRGLALKFISKEKGIRRGIVVSALIFGGFHLVNVLEGQRISYALIQVFFAFLAGIVFAEIVVITKSLWGVIIFHMVHDFVGYTAVSVMNTKEIIIVVIQVSILIVYGAWLWRKVSLSKN